MYQTLTWMYQNVSKDFLSAASKTQANTQGCYEDWIKREGTENNELKNFGYSINNILDTKKCDSCLITKCDKSLLQNKPGFF